MAITLKYLSEHLTFPVNAFNPIEYSDGERKEIVDKINYLVNGSDHKVVFFEYQPQDKIYSIIYYDVEKISFSEDKVRLAETKKNVEKFFSKIFKKVNHLISPKDITIIDAVYHRIRTTSGEVHDNRQFHPKVPHQTMCAVGRVSQMSIVDDFVRDTFDNLLGKSYNW